MVHRCRFCGIIAGGLVRDPAVDECNWPEPDRCPACVGKPDPEDEVVAEILRRARVQIGNKIIEELAGERVTADVMNFRFTKGA